MELSKAELAELESLEALEQQGSAAPAADTPEDSFSDRVMGAMTAFGQGVTLGYGDELGAGIRAPFESLEGESVGDAYGRIKGYYKEREDQFSDRNPALATGANIAGNVLTGALAPGAALGGKALIAREAALGGAEGFGSGDSISDLGMGVAFGGIGAKLGNIAGSVFGQPSSGQRVVDGISEVAARAEQRAKMKLLTKAQRTGSDTAKRIEAGLETLPIAGGATKRIKAKFQGELNRAAAKSIGINADKLTPDVLQAANNKISSMFDNAIQDKVIPISDDMVNGLLNTMDEYSSLPGAGDSIKKIGEDLFNELDKPMDAARYQKLSSFFGKKIKGAAQKGDYDLVESLGSMKNGLDDMVADGLGGESLTEFADARELYKNFIAITKNRHVVDAATGDVSGKRLFGELSKQNKSFNVKGELGDLARLSTVGGVGDSGTASRLLIPGAMAGGALAGGSMIDAGMGTGAALGGLRILDEISQAGVPGLTAGSGALLGGAIGRGNDYEGEQ